VISWNDSSPLSSSDHRQERIMPQRHLLRLWLLQYKIRIAKLTSGQEIEFILHCHPVLSCVKSSKSSAHQEVSLKPIAKSAPNRHTRKQVNKKCDKKMKFFNYMRTSSEEDKKLWTMCTALLRQSPNNVSVHQSQNTNFDEPGLSDYPWQNKTKHFKIRPK